DRQRRRLPVPAAAVRGREQAAEGPLEQLADLRQRPRRAELAIAPRCQPERSEGSGRSRRWDPSLRSGRQVRSHAGERSAAMTALHDLSAVELVARYRDRSLSPVEVTRAVLDRIAAWEPHLHATYALDPDAALAAARVSEARW